MTVRCIRLVTRLVSLFWVALCRQPVFLLAAVQRGGRWPRVQVVTLFRLRAALEVVLTLVI